ncbi:MAG TPA: hypothetical protein VK054_08960, partial [Beutenbergiaceae bacterium]|nr:hypothetical protein [Beutenbergiaceae bacterium]
KRARYYYRQSMRQGNIYARKQLAVLETFRGNLFIGLPLWLSAIMLGTGYALLAMFKIESPRMRGW